MQYNCRFESVEAQPVTLAGKPLMAFLAGGEMHLVSDEAFRLFFSPDAVAIAESGTPLTSAPPIRGLSPVASALVMSPVPPPVEAPKENLRAGRPRKSDPPRVKVESPGREQAVAPINGVMPVSKVHAVLLAVQEAPRTTAEITDRVQTAFPVGSRASTGVCVRDLESKGKLVRRDDKETQISRWYLAAAKSGSE